MSGHGHKGASKRASRSSGAATPKSPNKTTGRKGSETATAASPTNRSRRVSKARSPTVSSQPTSPAPIADDDHNDSTSQAASPTNGHGPEEQTNLIPVTDEGVNGEVEQETDALPGGSQGDVDQERTDSAVEGKPSCGDEGGLPDVDVQDPVDFDSSSFLSTLDTLATKLELESVRPTDENFPHDELKELVSAVTTSMSNFKAYSRHSQQQMEAMRLNMRDTSDRIHRHIQKAAYDPEMGERRGVEETELAAKIAQLNKDLARTAEDLTRASQVSAETEVAALEASLEAEKASEQAAQMQDDYEKRREAELEARKAEEERKAGELAIQEEEKRREEEARIAEEERQARLKKDDTVVQPWEEWPCFNYTLDEESDFDRGIGCIIRADPSSFKESQVLCTKVDQLQTNFIYETNEEVVSHVISLSPHSDSDTLREKVYVALPHCTTRASAMSREPVVKTEVDGKWVELTTQEVTLEAYKDLKLVQAEVSNYGLFVVVTKYKRDFLSFPKRGGKVVSNLDQRLTFTAAKHTFKSTEHFVVQLQPLDTSTLNDIRNRDECQGLLTASAVVDMEWTSQQFHIPIQMTLPCPPNPVKARKAAAVKAAKEAKMKNPQQATAGGDGTKHDSEHHKRHEKQSNANKWYMGQYALDDDDESESFYLVRPNTRGRWVTEKDFEITAIRLDLLQMALERPINRFMVLRVRTSVDDKHAEKMASFIVNQLAQRQANVVVKQRHDNLNDAFVQVVASSKLDRALKQLEDEEIYTEGPDTSDVIHLCEGDLLQVDFRGNIQAEPETPPLQMIYNSQLTTTLEFSVKEIDIFLQRNYPMYRGVVQVNKVTKFTKEAKEGENEGEQEECINRETKAEMVVGIPKVEMTNESKMVHRVPVTIKGEGPVTEDCLRQLAEELGEEWNNLAKILGINSIRLSAILRENQLNDEPMKDAKFDMLMTWRKKVPRSMDTAQILRHALQKCGRNDLANQLEDLSLDNNYSQEQEAV